MGHSISGSAAVSFAARRSAGSAACRGAQVTPLPAATACRSAAVAHRATATAPSTDRAIAVAATVHELEVAWAAGFFDGEGTITHTRNVPLMIAIKQATSSGAVPPVLARFAAAVGVGRIGGPYQDRPSARHFSPHRRPAFMWYAMNNEAVAVLQLLQPHLTGKLTEAEYAIANGSPSFRAKWEGVSA